MPAGEPPQEAEAHGLYSALLARPHFLHKAHALGLQPLEPDFIASDSKNSVHSALGQARLRHPRLQQWAAGVLPAMDDFTGAVVTFQTPRSANSAADHGAGTAVQLVRDTASGVDRLRRSVPPGMTHSGAASLSCALVDSDKLDVIVFNRPLCAYGVRDLEATGWRRLPFSAPDAIDA